MKILVLRSKRREGEPTPKDAYAQEFTSAYAEKVIGNLKGAGGFCTACGQECIGCRKAYKRSFARDIARVVDLPATLPFLLEKPSRHLPREIPPHDVLLAINVHEQILVEALKRCSFRGAVVPIEAPDWVSACARADAEVICRDKGAEISFPKPFCAFDPPAGGVLAEFRRRFHIGRPQVELTVRDGRIERAYVEVSAACGATYYVARGLEGRSLDDDLEHEVVSKRLHSYPCTASMKWDDEIGDTCLHVAAHAHLDILAPLGIRADDEADTVISPLGKVVAKPVPTRENIRNIENAKEVILQAVAAGSVPLQKLLKRPDIPPAAVLSALLLLKQEGKIGMVGRMIVKT